MIISNVPVNRQKAATQAVLFKIMIIISEHHAAAITLYKSSRAAKSDVETRRAVASMSVITSAEELVIST